MVARSALVLVYLIAIALCGVTSQATTKVITRDERIYVITVDSIFGMDTIMDLIDIDKIL